MFVLFNFDHVLRCTLGFVYRRNRSLLTRILAPDILQDGCMGLLAYLEMGLFDLAAWQMGTRVF
jgi:hypothetical protein